MSEAETAEGADAPRPSHAGGDEVALLTNDQLGRLFYEIADMLELKGELPFKVLAYRRAAEVIGHGSVDIARAYREGRPPSLPGVGRAIGDKLAELADTGSLRFHERLRAEIPPSLVGLLAVPGLGPRTIKQLHDALGIETPADLEAAAQAGRLRTVKGLSARTEQKILAGLAALKNDPPRLRLGQATEVAERVMRALAPVPGVRSLTVAGSLRRRRETIGDLDLLVATEDPGPVVERFLAQPGIERVVGRGGHKVSVRLTRGPQVELMVMPSAAAGTYLVHFTGSKAHNVRLREMARDAGWSLSEHGFLRLAEDGAPLGGEAAERRTFAREEEVYEFLGLPFIAPELREDRGEIEAALGGRLPRLVVPEDLQGDLHSHSDWSDGHLPIERLAEAMRRRGYRYQVLTDHSQSLTIANGLDETRVEAQRRLIAELNERFAREHAARELPPGAHPDGFRLLHGCELEIRVDGRLDYPDGLLERFDLVVASLHVGRRQPRAQLMERYFSALRNPHVDVIAHPSGRKIGIRPDLDLDWEVFFGEAARTGTLLEINGSDERLDLDDRRAREARDAGCRLTIDSDAHYLGELDNILWGVGLARRAWVEVDDVANTWPLDRLLAWTRDKAARLA